MKHLFKIKLAFLMVFFIQVNVKAQVKIGANSAPAASAVLELESGTNKGFLGPKVALTSTTDVSTISSPATGLLVYNTATAGSSPNNVTPGYYYYSGSAWVSMNGASNIYVSNGTLTGNRSVFMGSNTLAFDTTTLFINPSTNRVGIGTSTPANALDVVGNVNVKASGITANTGLRLTPTSGNSSSGYSPFTIQNYAGKNVFLIQQEVGADSTSIFFYTDGLDNGATANQRMAIKRATGYIGIGTSSPATKMHIAGDGTSSWFNSAIMFDNTGSKGRKYSISSRSNGQLILGDENSSLIRLTIDSTGTTSIDGSTFTVDAVNNRLGIGTSSPANALDVVGNVNVRASGITGNTGLRLRPTSGNSSSGFSPLGLQNYAGNSIFTIQQEAGTDSTSIFFYTDGLDNGATGNARMVIKRATGYIGIGTTSPSYPLTVAPTVTPSNYSYAYLNNTATVSTATSSGPVSIYAAGRILCTEFNAYSDERIKNIKGLSSNQKDLELLKKIEITDYTMKDSISKGTLSYKKVIAQQVEQVFPQVVKQVKDFVPNVYQFTEGLKALGGNHYQATWKNPIMVQASATGKFKLYDDKGEVLVTVNSMNENSITFSCDRALVGVRVFLFGEEVNDFRSVDYEGLSTLNISATQALSKMIESQQKTIEKQQEAMLSQQKQIDELKSMIMSNSMEATAKK
ncbi:MAG: tail fiber domain-containing protein [Bacteroidetes bacterium]|nr:tail fiber domain-containing protein [Bacteroidota bacterium]